MNRQDTTKTSIKLISRYILYSFNPFIILSAVQSERILHQRIQFQLNTQMIEPQAIPYCSSSNHTGCYCHRDFGSTNKHTSVYTALKVGDWLPDLYYIRKNCLAGFISQFTCPHAIPDSSKYPVLYLLHGKSYQDDQWIRLGLADIMNKKISK